MSRIQSLDEITDRLGTPALLRWVDAPFGAAAAVVRFRHRGATVDLSATSSFRLIFHLSSSEVIRQGTHECPSRGGNLPGSIVASFTQRSERIKIVSAADTLHLLFSPELAKACGGDVAGQLSLRVHPALRAGAVQSLVATALGGKDAQLERIMGDVARTIVENHYGPKLFVGGLSPHASRAVHDLLEKHLYCGVSVKALAETASLSVNHFIKTFRQSEGFTPHAMLLQRRVERAIRLLLHGKESVEEVAVILGFSSPSHFISAFRRMVGVTPAQLRHAAKA